MKKLLITGAGVDRTSGLNFPLANTLLSDITRYLGKEGKDVDKALREMLPGLRFDFNRMVSQSVDKIASRDAAEQRAMVERVKDAISGLGSDREHVRLHGELVISLFNKLATIADECVLDDSTCDLIRQVFGDAANEMLDSDSILDVHKLSLSDTFKSVLKKTLRMGLDQEQHEVAAALGSDMLNIESLLIEKFLGFYNNKASDIKNYIYISWALWAYLLHRQRLVVESCVDVPLPFYGNLPKDIRAVTLNYTSFLGDFLGLENVLYFHGGLAEYVRMDTRDLLQIDRVNQHDPASFIRSRVAPNVDLSNEDPALQKHVIPAMVPPLRLKPILSHRYIDVWSQASSWVSEAEHIVVVGYSLNSADEHFNDILRVHADKRIDVIAPDVLSPQYMNRVEKVFQRPIGQFSVTDVQGFTCKQSRDLRLISAKADQLDIRKLMGS